MNEKPRGNRTRAKNAGTTGGTKMRQADIKKVLALDLEGARKAVKEVVREELQSEIVSADVLNFRMKRR
jgi:hypothetical protein